MLPYQPTSGRESNSSVILGMAYPTKSLVGLANATATFGRTLTASKDMFSYS